MASLKSSNKTIDYTELYRYIEKYIGEYFYFEGMVDGYDDSGYVIALRRWERERWEECDEWDEDDGECEDWDVVYGEWYFFYDEYEPIWFEDYELIRLRQGEVVEFVGQLTRFTDDGEVRPFVKVTEINIVEK